VITSSSDPLTRDASNPPTGPVRGRRGRFRSALVPAVCAAALSVACGTSGVYGPSRTTQSSAPGAVVNTADTGIGTIVVAGNGRTIYEFANDGDATSTCTGSCAVDWPPVVAPDGLPSSIPLVTGELGSIARDDGTRQLTIESHPVYTFIGDTKAGQTNGHGIQLDGGLWTAVDPSGSPLMQGLAGSAHGASMAD
jgi:predicted lipoprotein with Yx(FWY)xxD motif